MNDNQDTEQQESKVQDKIALMRKNVAEFGRFSFELEERREQHLIEQSGHLLTAISLISAAFLMAIPIFAEYTNVTARLLIIATIIVFKPIVVSIVFCLLVQWRYGYQTMKNATQLREAIETSNFDYTEQKDYDYQWENQLSAVQVSKQKINDLRATMLKISLITLLASVFSIVNLTTLYCLFYL